MPAAKRLHAEAHGQSRVMPHAIDASLQFASQTAERRRQQRKSVGYLGNAKRDGWKNKAKNGFK